VTSVAAVHTVDEWTTSQLREAGIPGCSILGSTQLTVRQLLNHTSGLADTVRAFLSVHPLGAPPVDTAAALERYRIRSRRSPGNRVEYRNVNYAILGEIVHPRGSHLIAHTICELLRRALR
jgi:hypothetical protein